MPVGLFNRLVVELLNPPLLNLSTHPPINSLFLFSTSQLLLFSIFLNFKHTLPFNHYLVGRILKAHDLDLLVSSPRLFCNRIELGQGIHKCKYFF